MKGKTSAPGSPRLRWSLFLLPLIGIFEFSLRMRRGSYSFDAYRVVLADPQFQATFGYSVLMALLTILLGVLLVVPTAYWVRLRLPGCGPFIEFITLLPLVIPAIVIVFGYIRLYNTSSILPLTGARGTNLLLMFGYVDAGAALYVSLGRYRPAHHRCPHPDGSGRRASAPAGSTSCRVILPNVLVAVLSRRLPDLRHRHRRIHHGGAAQRPAFGPSWLIGANRAYEPSALAVIAFAITWAAWV